MPSDRAARPREVLELGVLDLGCESRVETATVGRAGERPLRLIAIAIATASTIAASSATVRRRVFTSRRHDRMRERATGACASARPEASKSHSRLTSAGEHSDEVSGAGDEVTIRVALHVE